MNIINSNRGHVDLNPFNCHDLGLSICLEICIEFSNHVKVSLHGIYKNKLHLHPLDLPHDMRELPTQAFMVNDVVSKYITFDA